MSVGATAGATGATGAAGVSGALSGVLGVTASYLFVTSCTLAPVARAISAGFNPVLSMILAISASFAVGFSVKNLTISASEGLAGAATGVATGAGGASNEATPPVVGAAGGASAAIPVGATGS